MPGVTLSIDRREGENPMVFLPVRRYSPGRAAHRASSLARQTDVTASAAGVVVILGDLDVLDAVMQDWTTY